MFQLRYWNIDVACRWLAVPYTSTDTTRQNIFIVNLFFGDLVREQTSAICLVTHSSEKPGIRTVTQEMSACMAKQMQQTNLLCTDCNFVWVMNKRTSGHLVALPCT